MSPFRWDVLLVGFVLAVPVLALGLRGDLTTEEMMTAAALVPGRGLGRGRAAAVRRHPATPPAEARPPRPGRCRRRPAPDERALARRLTRSPALGVFLALRGVLQDP